MPRNAKPRKAYRPRPAASIYPDLHDIGLIFWPIHTLFEQLRTGEVDSAGGEPIFKDWMGEWCGVVPALEGWALCWERIAAGERLPLDVSATRRLAKRLKFGVPLTAEDVERAWQEILATQKATLRIPRKRLGDYMRTEQIAIELERLGVVDAA